MEATGSGVRMLSLQNSRDKKKIIQGAINEETIIYITFCRRKCKFL